jgi:hypothetical protein
LRRYDARQRDEASILRGTGASRFVAGTLRRRGKATVRLARVKITSEPAADAGRLALALANGRRIECEPAQLAHLIRTAE